jgi:hypothetical protein
LIVENCVIDVFCLGGQNDISTYGINSDCDNLIIKNNIIKSGAKGKSAGIVMKNAEANRILYNEVIVYSVLCNVEGGIKVKESRNVRVINNTVRVTSPSNDYAVHLWDCFATILMNNIVVGDHNSLGLWHEDSNCDTIRYNDFFAHDTISVGVALDETNFKEDPLFYGIEPDSVYYIKIDSPKDRGHPSPIYNDPDGTRNDIGAHYYQQEGVAVSRPRIVPTENSFICFPNPTNSAVRLSFSISTAGWIEIDAYNSAGRLVSEITKGYLTAGTHCLPWNMDDKSSGVYFIKMTHSGHSELFRIVLQK